GLITTSNSPGGDIATAASLVTTPEVASLVAVQLGDTTPRQLLKQVSAVPVAESNVVAITAEASTAQRAQAIASLFATNTVKSRTQILHRQLETIIPALKRQIAAGEGTDRGALGERLAALQALLAAPDPTVSVASLAQRPTAPAAPRKQLSVIAGIIAGLIIG